MFAKNVRGCKTEQEPENSQSAAVLSDITRVVKPTARNAVNYVSIVHPINHVLFASAINFRHLKDCFQTVHVHRITSTISHVPKIARVK